MTQTLHPGSTPVTTVVSPDGELHLVLERSASGSLLWRVWRDEDVVAHHAIQSSALAVAFAEAVFVVDLTVTDPGSPSEHTRSFSLPHGKRRAASATCTEQRVTVANAQGQHLAIDLVVFNDGVAHRFHTVDADSAGWNLMADSTAFVFDPDGTAYMQAHDDVGLVKPAAEAVFEALPVGTQFPALPGWSFPALFHSSDQWTLVTEVGVAAHNAGSHLRTGLTPGEYVLSGPGPAEGEGPIVVTPDTPWALPWKVVVTTPTAGGVVASDMVSLLTEPTSLTDLDWIRPGRVSWGWWSDSHSPTNPEALRAFIDLAAQMGWEYSLIDANWNKMPAGTIEALVAYAAERGIGLFLWYNSGGPHNVVTEEPRNRMHDREARRAEMAWLRDVGIVGIKVDFFQSDKPSMNALALDMLTDAAEFGILMNFHGITAPKGWHVTWPHLMTTEAVRGSEQYKFDPQYPVAAARHHTILAFTRNVVAPMDYTPITLSDVDFPHLTSNAHELALGVLFESSLQHPADKPEIYLGLPDEAQRYLRELPVVWDDVVVLSGEPGSHVAMARRHEDRWWIAGINGTHKPMQLEMDVTPLGISHPLTVVRDGSDSRSLSIEELNPPGVATFALTMAPRGGFVAFPN